MTTTGHAVARPAARWAMAIATATLVACAPGAPSGWSGYVEGEFVYVAAPLGGTLTALAVRRGQDVTRGAALFTLDDTPERAALEEARARERSAGAQARNTASGRRAEEIAVIEAHLAQARAQAVLAAAELSRVQALRAQGFVSEARIDDARTAARQADARVAELVAALRVARLPARSDERAAADALADAARAAVEQQQWREYQKRATAPADAQVADTFYRVGEFVAAGQPVLALLPPDAVRARFFVPEAELGALRIGQPVLVRCDGCGEPIAARVDFIATRAEYTPPVIYSNAQRARLVFMVEARPEGRDAARLKPGQPVDVTPAPAGTGAAR